MDQQTRQIVRERAGGKCEYCRLHQLNSPLARLQIEHILPRKHGGSDELGNLALACIDCNLHKDANLTGIDPKTNRVVELFNPRRQTWEHHFEWDGCVIIGISAVGRTTVRVLQTNSEDRIRVRLANL